MNMPLGLFAFFIGIYDVLDNMGLRAGEGAAALSAGPNNACTVWGNTYYLPHPSWGTACALWLAGSHGSVSEYGGKGSMYGFWSMSLCDYGCAVTTA